MSARMQYPLSQRRHTNIAVVRYQKHGVRLEIACYKNKVISYRSGTEDRMDEVLQVDRVFSNVGRGHVASKEDIATVFGPDMTEQDAIKFMLEHGELQVAQQERSAEVDEIFKDVAIFISQRCVNTNTQRPFPSLVIEQALRSIGAGVKLDQPVKKQALAFIYQLIDSEIIPIARANMKVRCLTPTEDAVAAIAAWCEENSAQIVERKTSMANGDGAAKHSLLVLLQPNLFRELDTFVKEQLPSGSTVHVVDSAVMEVGEGDAAVIARSAATDGDGPSTDMDATSSKGRGRHGSRGTSTARGGGKNRQHNSDSDDDDDDDDDGARGGKGRRRKDRKKKGGRGQRAGDSSDDDDDDTGAPKGGVQAGNDSDDDDDAGGRRGKKKGGKKGKQQQRAGKAAAAPVVGGCDELTAQLMKLGLDPAADLGSDDSDDDGGRKKGRRGKGRKR